MTSQAGKTTKHTHAHTQEVACFLHSFTLLYSDSCVVAGMNNLSTNAIFGASAPVGGQAEDTHTHTHTPVRLTHTKQEQKTHTHPPRKFSPSALRDSLPSHPVETLGSAVGVALLAPPPTHPTLRKHIKAVFCFFSLKKKLSQKPPLRRAEHSIDGRTVVKYWKHSLRSGTLKLKSRSATDDLRRRFFFFYVVV